MTYYDWKRQQELMDAQPSNRRLSQPTPREYPPGLEKEPTGLGFMIWFLLTCLVVTLLVVGLLMLGDL